LAVLDVPLLFESGGWRRCDAVVVVWAPPMIQRERVLKRPGMTQARLAFIRQTQVSDGEKRRRADFLVPSGLGRALTWRRLGAAVRAAAARKR
jgi:dephospho-CoA kinase